ncbi:2-dehydropantoate 2-reductase [Pseudoalteromonas sp. YIC-656]|uniref:2-dehydropantoate 2-reductase n=1 Tax=Pseudoalteromonas pernae TaxID=3118054 RepID=UPI003242822D
MRIAVFGAGSTGCYLAALLSVAKLSTSIVCRERIKNAIEDNEGIHITDYQGFDKRVMPNALLTDTTGQQFDVVFVTVKCHQLPEVAQQLLNITHAQSELIFMQNGLGSFDAIETQMAQRRCLFGITPFNVLQNGAHFHKGTQGEFCFEQSDNTQFIAQKLQDSGFGCHIYDDMKPVVFGKLLLNLNNALNAIADMPIKAELENHAIRRTLAGAMREWIAVAKAMDCELAQFTKVKPAKVRVILSLPNWLFKRVASAMLDIDPKARSSMWEDIQAGRKTEVEFLNGAVVKLGAQHNVPTPINQAIVQSIHKLERGETVDITRLAVMKS